MKAFINIRNSVWRGFFHWFMLWPLVILAACEPWNLDRIDHLQITTLPELAAPEAKAATVAGRITGIEVEEVTRHGFLWSQNNFEFELEDVDDAEVFLADLGKKGINGEFVGVLAPLDSNTTYYYRAFAVQGAIACYGDVESFQTAPVEIKVQMVDVMDITANGVDLIGALEGLPRSFTAEEHGFVWSTDSSKLDVQSGTVLPLGKALSNGVFTTRLDNTIQADETFYIRSFFKRGDYYYSCSRFAITRREGWSERTEGTSILPVTEGGVVFTINETAYFGAGRIPEPNNQGELIRSFWKLQYSPGAAPAIDSVADFEGAPVAFGVGFTLEGRGYVGTGLTENDVLVNDFWRFDTTGDGRWTQVTVSGAAPEPRMGAVAFVIGNKAYVGLGRTATGAQQDFYAFSPVTGWEKLPQAFPGPPRSNAVAFVIDGKAYVGAGVTGDFLRLRDFYEFDPGRSGTDQWEAISALPGDARDAAVAFSLGGKGYVGLGSGLFGMMKQDLWAYLPGKKEWRAVQNFAGIPRRHAIAFALENAGWIGLGSNFFREVDSPFWTWPADDIQQQEIEGEKCPQ